jgi:hypothetical protein
MRQLIMAAIVSFMAGFLPCPLSFVQFVMAIVLAFVGLKRLEQERIRK